MLSEPIKPDPALRFYVKTRAVMLLDAAGLARSPGNLDVAAGVVARRVELHLRTSQTSPTAQHASGQDGPSTTAREAEYGSRYEGSGHEPVDHQTRLALIATDSDLWTAFGDGPLVDELRARVPDGAAT